MKNSYILLYLANGGVIFSGLFALSKVWARQPEEAIIPLVILVCCGVMESLCNHSLQESGSRYS